MARKTLCSIIRCCCIENSASGGVRNTESTTSMWIRMMILMTSPKVFLGTYGIAQLAQTEPPLDNVSDLQKDKLVMWQHRWVHQVSFVVSFGLPALIGYLYAISSGNLSPLGGALGGY